MRFRPGVNLLIVPAFAGITFGFVRLAAPPPDPLDQGAPAAHARTPEARVQREVPRGQSQESPLIAAERESVVDLTDYSDLERTLVEQVGSRRAGLTIVLEATKRRMTRLMRQAKEVCEAKARPSHPDSDVRQHSRVQVAAWVETKGNQAVLSAVTVTPWDGAALAPAYANCLAAYARANANANVLDEKPFPAQLPAFAGSHHMMVDLETTCTAELHPR